MPQKWLKATKLCYMYLVAQILDSVVFKTYVAVCLWTDVQKCVFKDNLSI